MSRSAAVLGSPIGHSLSPLIHNFVYKKLGLDYEYLAVEVRENEFVDWITRALTKSDAWFGFSLTMPLKELVFSEKLKEMINFDLLSTSIQSANTLYKRQNRWFATSTDAKAIEFLLKDEKFKSVVVIGSGGTAKAALAALDQLATSRPVEVNLIRRNSARDKGLLRCVSRININIRDWSELRITNGCDLVINTVPAEVSDSIASELDGKSSLLDVVYAPWPPKLTKNFLDQGSRVITGLDLLCCQALYQVELMLNRELDKEELAKEVMLELRRHTEKL